MGRKEVQQFRMQEGFAAEDAEIAIAVTLGVVDDPVQILERKALGWSFHIDPTALTAQLATGNHRDEQEWRERHTTLQAALVFLDRTDALDAEVVDELPDHLWIRFS